MSKLNYWQKLRWKQTLQSNFKLNDKTEVSRPAVSVLTLLLSYSLMSGAYASDKGKWTSLGPDSAVVTPYSTLSRFLSDPSAPFYGPEIGATTTLSGRVTTMAIDPNCKDQRCRLWVGTASGGLWLTENALSTKGLKWTQLAKGLSSVAMGDIFIDPNDKTANTLYLGTGEESFSSDALAGTGLYKSINGGNTWQKIDTRYNGSDFTFSRAIGAVTVDPHNPNILYVGTVDAIFGNTPINGGRVHSTGFLQPTLGVYKSTDGGASWSLVWDASNAIPFTPYPDFQETATHGVTQIVIDENEPTTVYASATDTGVYRSAPSLENGDATFKPVFKPAVTIFEPTWDHTAIALTHKNGHARLYASNGSLGVVFGGADRAGQLYRIDNADIPASSMVSSWLQITANYGDRSNPRAAATDICGGQCDYDNVIATPKGQPDTVVVGGQSTLFALFAGLMPGDNNRVVMRSTTAGDPDVSNNNRTFTDITGDANLNAKTYIHADAHAIVFAPQNPNVIFIGTDGGVFRTSGNYVDGASICSARNNLGTPIDAASLLYCQRVLSSIPSKIYSLNDGLMTLQTSFVAVSKTGDIMTGTQDNGHFMYQSGKTWTMINGSAGGDGYQGDFDAVDPSISYVSGPIAIYNEISVNHHNNDPSKWVRTDGPINAAGEFVPFNSTLVADPKVGGTAFAGYQHVWRTQDNGGDQTFLESNCLSSKNMFTRLDYFGALPANCGDWQPIGSDLTGPDFGTSRAGRYVSAMARSSADNKTLWVATRMGRVFVTHNADAANPANVNFIRLDTLASNSPPRFVSSIDTDPNDPNVAYIAYSAFDTSIYSPDRESFSPSDPNKPGHVFKVSYNPQTNTATWQRLDDNVPPNSPNYAGPQFGDQPVNAIVYDAKTKDIYVGLDFGVFRRDGTTGKWDTAGKKQGDGSLPVGVEVSGFKLIPEKRLLYMSSYGSGIWVLTLDK